MHGNGKRVVKEGVAIRQDTLIKVCACLLLAYWEVYVSYLI